MKIRKSFKTLLMVLASSSGLIVVALGIDIVLFGSIYHPLTYAYNSISWLECKISYLPNCSKTFVSTSSPINGKNGIVVTSQHEASKVGLQILKQGGNAIDAAVAVGYALAVTDPCCGNIGGGGFMLIHLANGKNTFINFREKAPLLASKNMYLNKEKEAISGLSNRGYLAVAIPGTVMGLEQSLERYGTMTRKQVIAPAIRLAENGFILQQGDIKIIDSGIKKFKEQPNIAKIFLKNGKASYRSGDRLVQKELAITLKLIANKGSDAFYKGAIARSLVKASKAGGGILSLKDFTNYTVSETHPIQCNYRGYQIISAPLPGGGTTLCQMLNILEGYPLGQMKFHSANSLHPMLSSMLYAYADRNKYLGDPNFVKSPVTRLLSKDYAAQIRTKILPDRATPPNQLYSGIATHEGVNTTHYSIYDRYGNAVAVTYTINSYFGAGVIAGNTGFFLNNEMDDFAVLPGEPNQFGLVQGNANAIEPGKQPLSSMSPTIVMKNSKVFLVTGSPGGPTIPTTVLQVISNVIDYRMNIAETVNATRIHYQGLPNLVITEPFALEPTAVQSLWEMGYKIAPFMNWGAAETILVNPETEMLYGVNDIRRSAGKAVAY